MKSLTSLTAILIGSIMYPSFASSAQLIPASQFKVQEQQHALAANRIFPVSSAQDIATAMLTADSGDVLEMNSQANWSNEIIQFARSVPGAGEITLQPDTPGSVVLTGTSRISISGDRLVIKGIRFENGLLDPSNAGEDFIVQFREGASPDAAQATRSRMVDCVISGYGSVNNGKYNWVSLYGQYNTIEHCFFERHDHNGATVVVPRLSSAPDHHRIRNNHFRLRPKAPEPNPTPSVSANWETIRIGNSDTSLSASYTTVENNLLEQTNGEAEAISNKSGRNIFRYNTFVDVEGSLTLRHGNDCLVTGNYFLGNGRTRTGGLRVNGTGHTIVNNYFFGVGDRFDASIALLSGDSIPALDSYAPANDVVIQHNSFIDCLPDGILLDSELCGNCTVHAANGFLAKNLFASRNAQFSPVVGNPGAGWTSSANYGSTLLDGNVTPSLEPGFSFEDLALQFDSQAQLWRVSSMSPAINQPDPLVPQGFVWEDVEGQQRGITNATPGADDLGTTESLRAPLKPGDVGPRWMGRFTWAASQAVNGTCFIQAENFSSNIDVDLLGQHWDINSPTLNSSGPIVKAKSGPDSNAPSSRLTYRFVPDIPGTYTIYLRYQTGNSSAGFFVPSGFGVDPSTPETVNSNSQFEWHTSQSYPVPQSLVGTELEYRIARQTPLLRLDALVLSTNNSLTDQALNALLP